MSEHATWTIKLISDDCPYMGSVRNDADEGWPCRHTENEIKMCLDSCCPISENKRSMQPPLHYHSL